jgi:uncharacterized protein DUF6415
VNAAVVTYNAENARTLIVTAQDWQHGVYPPHAELADTTEKLRVLLGVLLSDAEGRAAKLLEGSPARQTLAHVIADAQYVVAAGPGPGLVSATNHARALANAAERLLRDRGVSPR